MCIKAQGARICIELQCVNNNKNKVYIRIFTRLSILCVVCYCSKIILCAERAYG